jgi:hypothetical protein
MDVLGLRTWMGALSLDRRDHYVCVSKVKGKFPAGQDPDALMVEKDVTERGDDY